MTMSAYVRRLRAALGSSRILLASVGGLVRDAEGRLLFVETRDSKVWTTPGGAIELEDTPADAIVREMWEETGLIVVPRRVFGVYGGPNFIVEYPNGDETQYISILFECDVIGGSLREAGDGDEVETARFWSQEEAAALPLSPWLVRVLPRLFETHDGAWFEAPTWQPPIVRD